VLKSNISRGQPNAKSQMSASVLHRKPRKEPGRLCSIDFTNTSVTIENLIRSFEAAHSGQIRMKSIGMNGQGDILDDNSFREMLSCIDPTCLLHLDIGCFNGCSGTSDLSDIGLKHLSRYTCLHALKRVCLAGHISISGSGVADILLVAKNLVDLDLSDCKGIGNDNDPDHTLKLNALSDAISSFGREGGKNCGGLERLSLSRCFESTKKAKNIDEELVTKQDQLGHNLIDSICNSTSRITLKELNLTGCWFLTNRISSGIIASCPGLKNNQGVGNKGLIVT